MAVRTRIEQVNLNYEVMLKDTLSPEAQKKFFADRAASIIGEARAHNARVLGRVPDHTISVDGRIGAPLSSVRIPGGVVFVEFEIVFEAIIWIGQMLRKHSPVKTGRYRDSHVLLADGIAVDADAVPPIAEQYEFVNIQPYARKIERGLSPQSPKGVYQVVAHLASARFGNVARIRFGHVTPMFGAINTWAGTRSAARMAQKRGGRKDRRGEWLRRQPAIIVTMPGK